MSKSFHVRLKTDPELVISKAKVAASKNGVLLDGSAEVGQFTGHGIVGQYRISDNNLSIEISKKPMIMPWSLIESTIRKFFA